MPNPYKPKPEGLDLSLRPAPTPTPPKILQKSILNVIVSDTVPEGEVWVVNKKTLVGRIKNFG